MFNINTKELAIKWKKSQKQINTLLEENDAPTKDMWAVYKVYMNDPCNSSMRSLFEYTFCGWYKNNVEG